MRDWKYTTGVLWREEKMATKRASKLNGGKNIFAFDFSEIWFASFYFVPVASASSWHQNASFLVSFCMDAIYSNQISYGLSCKRASERCMSTTALIATGVVATSFPLSSFFHLRAYFSLFVFPVFYANSFNCETETNLLSYKWNVKYYVHHQIYALNWKSLDDIFLLLSLLLWRLLLLFVIHFTVIICLELFGIHDEN